MGSLTTRVVSFNICQHAFNIRRILGALSRVRAELAGELLAGRLEQRTEHHSGKINANANSSSPHDECDPRPRGTRLCIADSGGATGDHHVRSAGLNRHECRRDQPSGCDRGKFHGHYWSARLCAQTRWRYHSVRSPGRIGYECFGYELRGERSSGLTRTATATLSSSSGVLSAPLLRSSYQAVWPSYWESPSMTWARSRGITSTTLTSLWLTFCAPPTVASRRSAPRVAS